MQNCCRFDLRHRQGHRPRSSQMQEAHRWPITTICLSIRKTCLKHRPLLFLQVHPEQLHRHPLSLRLRPYQPLVGPVDPLRHPLWRHPLWQHLVELELSTRLVLQRWSMLRTPPRPRPML